MAALSDFPVTLTFIALAAAALLPLTAWIGIYRGKVGILRGHGDDPVLFKRTRIHANFVETAPLTILSVFAAEGLGMAQVWLWASVFAYLAGRIGHYALYDDKRRGVPMVLTTGPGFLLGIWVLLKLWT